MNNPQQIAFQIKQSAKEKNITVKQLLENCGLNINTISELSKGKQISYVNFAKIADYLAVSVDYLLGRTDNPMISSGSCYVGDNKNGIVQTNNGSAVVNANLTEQKSADIIGQFLQAFDTLKIEDKVEVMYFALQKAKTTKE